MAVDLVTIHHEGAGVPSDEARGAAGGYSYWIGATHFERLRSVYTSYATLHFNHVSLDICLSGNRMGEDVTDADIALIHGAFMDARLHGEVIDRPRVQFHRDNNGKYYYRGSLFYTVCPGDRAVALRSAIEGACRVDAGPTPEYVAFLVKIDHWRHRVNAMPLRYGGRGPDVQILNDLLVRHGYLKSSGNKYGIRTWAAVRAFKDDHHWPKGPTRSGRKFGGPAADVMVGLG